MKNNFCLFHPVYLLYKGDSVLFFREHIDFFLELYKFIFNNKLLYFFDKDLFIKKIIYMSENYINTNTFNNEINTYILKMINSILFFRRKKDFDIYIYLISFCGIVFILSYYYIGIFSSSSLLSSNQKDILKMISFLFNKYEIQPKLIICLENKNLQKGIVLYYKNTIIDISLKKIYELLNKEIDK